MFLLCLLCTSCVMPDGTPTIETRDLRTIETCGVGLKIGGITVVEVSPRPESIKPSKGEKVEIQTVRMQQPKQRETFTARVTAYCPCKRCCGPRARGRTATGDSAWSRGVAADWRYWPPGTVVYIEGYGEAVVDDKGGKIKGKKRFDIRMTYHWQARDHGDQDVEVIILRRAGE